MEPQFKTPVTARIRGSDRSLPPFGDRNQLKTNDKVYGMTPPGVFFLAIFQQTANLKQICLYDSAICQQLQNVHNHFRSVKDCVYRAFWGFRYVRAYRYCTRSSGHFDHLITGIGSIADAPPERLSDKKNVDILSTPSSGL